MNKRIYTKNKLQAGIADAMAAFLMEEYMCNIIDRVKEALSEAKFEEEFVISIPIIQGKGRTDVRKEIQTESSDN